jgi:hypothetical protein
MKSLRSTHLAGVVVLGALLVAASARAQAKGTAGAGQDQVAKRLETFDDLDFNVYTGQKWDEVKRSHAPDIIVHWPDGRTTKGLEKHIEDMKVMFTFAPDNRIRIHPVKFGSGDWTAVTGWLEGTFTKPMVLPNGKAIQPTGKAYRIPMATIAHWNRNGVMDEEYLFWDNAEFMKQIGLGQ